MSEYFKIKTRPAMLPANLPVRLPVSMNSPAHCGESFKAICGWVSERFSDVTIIIADTLQAYNLNGGRNAARELGNQWIEQNQKALALFPDAKITRWDDWLDDPRYSVARERVDNMYQNDSFFKLSIDTGTARFLKNRQLNGMRSQWEAASRGLLLEEAAVILSDQRHALEFYPGTVPALTALGKHSNIRLVRVEPILIKHQGIAA